MAKTYPEIYEKCPCCGGAIVGAKMQWLKKQRILIWDGGACSLSERESMVFDVLWRARSYGEPIPRERIISAAYAGMDAPKNEASAGGYVSIILAKLRRKTREAGLTIVGYYCGVGQHDYRLMALQLKPKLVLQSKALESAAA